MFCAKCGAALTEADKFCAECGTLNPDYDPALDEAQGYDGGDEQNYDQGYDANAGQDDQGYDADAGQEDQGYDPNAGQGYDANVGQGYDPNVGQDYDPNYGQGYEQGYDPNYNQGYDQNYAPNYNQGYEQGYDPNYNQGYEQGYDPNYNQGYEQGYDPNYNQNYDQNYDQGYDPDAGQGKVKKSMPKGLKIGIGIVAAAVIVAGGFFAATRLVLPRIGGGGSSDGYIPSGLAGLVKTNGDIVFPLEEGPVVFSGKFVRGNSTPDHKKFILKDEKDRLIYYSSPKAEGEKIVKEASGYSIRSNDGFFYFEEEEDYSLYSYYDFKTAETIKLGMVDCNISTDGTAIIGADEDQESILLYVVGDKEPIELADYDDNIEINGVANGGKYAIWKESDKNGDRTVFLWNGKTVEELAELDEGDSFHYEYFNNGKSLLYYVGEDNEMTLINGSGTHTFKVPVDAGSVYMYTRKGYPLDRRSTEEDIYMLVWESGDSDEGCLLSLDAQGKASVLAKGVGYTGSRLSVADKKLFYLDDDENLRVLKLDGKETKGEKVASDVSNFAVSADGKYFFMEKNEGLYYGKVSDKNYDTEKIDKDDYGFLILPTQKGDEIYYRTGENYELYSYKIGKEPVKISKNISRVIYTDSGYNKYIYFGKESGNGTFGLGKIDKNGELEILEKKIMS